MVIYVKICYYYTSGDVIMDKNSQTKAFIISIVGIITLIVFVVGATYAYFQAQGGETGNINVNAGTATTDNLSFQVGSAINLTVNQEDFGEGAGNKSGKTFARATLTANNSTNNAARNYYVYLSITDNNFEYTTEDKQAEILLKVTDPYGSEVTTLGGLEKKTSGSGDNEVTGFDITTSKAFIEIARNYEITASPSATQEWQVEVIFVNLDSNQNTNTNKTFNANLIIQEEETLTLANYITNYVYTEDGENGLYYHDGTGSYTNADQEAGDYSYRYSGGDYQVTEKAISEGITRVYSASATETDGVINFYCNGEKQFVSYYYCNLNSDDYYYTLAYNEIAHYNTLEDALAQAVNDGYLTADNIKNFVCFGSDADICPRENLYRIIGVFDGQIKLIKYDYADTTMLGENGEFSTYNNVNNYSGLVYNSGQYYWFFRNNTNGVDSTNDWESSNLNKINLNINFINYLGNKWSSLISTSSWQTGGNTLSNIRDKTAKNVYNNEIVSPTVNVNYSAKIGLIYVSDYMYAVYPTGWMNLGYDSNTFANGYNANKGENWMYMGLYDWCITRPIDFISSAFIISAFGYVYTNYVYNFNNGDNVRPVFYLNSDVQIYEGHSGTASDPYRIVF